MTALTVPARPEQDAGLRPLPWRRMAWVTWRQHRIALAGVVALLGGLAVYLWLTGLQIHHAYTAAVACHPASSVPAGRWPATSSPVRQTAQIIAVLLQAVPALIGAFVGAPVLAREMETGTFRYAWTQGFGRWRWTLAKLVPLAVVVAAAAGALSVLLSWFYQPFFAARTAAPRSRWIPACSTCAGSRSPPGRWPPSRSAPWPACSSAGSSPPSPPPWPPTPGSPCGRAVPAPALPDAAAHHERNLPGSAWILNQWYDQGRPAGQPGRARPGPPEGRRSSAAGRAGSRSVPAVKQYLAQHGYTLWTSYQPGSRFWPFQWIEGGWLLALSVLLIAATVWLVRRRAA